MNENKYRTLTEKLSVPEKLNERVAQAARRQGQMERADGKTPGRDARDGGCSGGRCAPPVPWPWWRGLSALSGTERRQMHRGPFCRPFPSV